MAREGIRDVTHSMTGFARSSATSSDAMVTVECRSVNNRYLDLHFKLPELMRNLEPALRELIGGHLHRGKVEIAIRYQADQDNPNLAVDPQRLSAIARALHEVGEMFPSAPPSNQLDLLLAPGVLTQATPDAAAIQALTLEAAGRALEELRAVRAAEGAKLRDFIMQRCEALRQLISTLRKHQPDLVSAQRDKMLSKIAELGVSPDSQRLEEEMVIYAQRADVAEEMDRIDAHLDAVINCLDKPEPCGRRLDFLMQELNREANTLGSKAVALSSTEAAIEMKVLIEQIREQVQNIE